MIHNIIIYHQNGLAMITRQYRDKFSSVLSGLLTTLMDSSVEYNTEKKIEKKVIELDLFNLSLIKRKNVILIASTDKEDDLKQVNELLNIILKQFVKNYSEIIENWTGDTRTFKEFETIIDRQLKKGKIRFKTKK